MSWRRFTVLLAHLPIESRYMTAVRNTADPSQMPDPTPGVFGPWPQSDMLLARIGDLIEGLLWQNQGDGNKPRPKPYPRPGTESNVRPISAEGLAWLEYKRAHQGADPPEGWVPA